MVLETLHFEVHLLSECWDRLPHIEIFLNDTRHYDNLVPKGLHIIKFSQECQIDNLHTLKIARFGKDNKQVKIDQSGIIKDQYVEITKLIINGVDCTKNDINIMASKSSYVPEYPEPWASQQREAGIQLEKEVPGAVNLGHNGIWFFKFSCPFMVFIEQIYLQNNPEVTIAYYNKNRLVKYKVRTWDPGVQELLNLHNENIVIDELNPSANIVEIKSNLPLIAKTKAEKIKFNIVIQPTYFYKSPHLEIYLNNKRIFSDLITKETDITFNELLDFNTNYELKLVRSNWDVKQVFTTVAGEKLEQCLEIKKLIIDDINCEWLCYDNSYAIYDYPQHFVAEQKKLGIELKEKNYGTKTLTFNSIWVFNFSSPFYEYIMKCMGGGIF